MSVIEYDFLRHCFQSRSTISKSHHDGLMFGLFDLISAWLVKLGHRYCERVLKTNKTTPPLPGGLMLEQFSGS